MIGFPTTLPQPNETEDNFMSHDTPGHGYHLPVLLDEVVAALEPGPGKIFVDGTLGGGGHTEALLETGAEVIGIDQDPEALAHAKERLSGHAKRFRTAHSSYHEVESVLKKMGVKQVHGALLDLGVSSHQLDTPERGFSFQQDGPLDMRMNPKGAVTAGSLVNTASEEQLGRIFREYGEEVAGRRAAARIVKERAIAPITRTLQLAQLIEGVIPRKGRAHPATKIFQALRIAVNRELEVLTSGLDAFRGILAPGGRFAVITFHSLEDRIVKTYFKERSVEWLDRPEWPEPRRNPQRAFKLISRRPIIAGLDEQRTNPRSRSAKLRIVQRLSYASI